MAMHTKDHRVMTVKLARDASDCLEEMTRESTVTRTALVENAIRMYYKDYKKYHRVRIVKPETISSES